MVVAIIGLVAGVVTVNSSRARAQARDARRQADLQLVAGALELYRAEQRHYPNSQALQSGGFLGSWDLLKAELYPKYLSSWPQDPGGQPAGANFGDGYVYATNTSALGSPGAYYALDGALEGTPPVTNPTLTQYQGSNGNQEFFTTGTYQSQGYGNRVHYRVSGP